MNHLLKTGGVNKVYGMPVQGYVSMEAFLSSKTDVSVSSSVPTSTYYIGNYALGGAR